MVILWGNLPARTIRQRVDRETPIMPRTSLVRMNLTLLRSFESGYEHAQCPATSRHMDTAQATGSPEDQRGHFDDGELRGLSGETSKPPALSASGRGSRLSA